MTTPAVIYVRQSKDRAGDGDAVERQRADCEALARSRGWDVIAVQEDNDTSAAGGKQRPGFLAVLEHVAAGRARTVVAWDLTRLTRNSRDRLRLLEVGRAAGATIALVRGSDMDLSTPAGRLTADILASVAQHEIEQKGDRQRRAGEQRRGRGEALWTRRPYGYGRAPDGRVVVVPGEAAALRWAAMRVLDGDTLASIARTLDARGRRTSLGGRWSVTGLRRVLLNPRATGAVTHLGRVVGSGTWPVILDADTQARVAEVLRDPRRRLQQSVELKHMLSGAVLCGLCGNRLYGQPFSKGSRRWVAYICKPSQHLGRRADLVDEVVTRVILERLSRPDAAAVFVPDVDLDALRGRAAVLRARRDDLAGMLADGLLSAASVREQASRITGELAEIERHIDASGGSSPVAALVASDDVAAAWEALTVRARRDIVDRLVTVTVLPAGKGVRFRPQDVRIDWRSGVVADKAELA